MRRVPEVIDVWFDSGAMPFAQHHYPFEHEQRVRARLPRRLHLRGARPDARLVLLAAGGLDALLGRCAPYRNVVCLGLILDAEGQKMSKSRGNVVEPWEVLDEFGADAFRWYFLTSKPPWDGYRFSIEAIGDGVRLFLTQLWSTYYFYVLYAKRRRAAARQTARGRAIRPTWTAGSSRALAATAELVAERLEPTTQPAPGARSPRSSRSSRTGTCAARGAASGTPTRRRSRRCATVLVTVSQLLAPFCPFIADEIYDNLDGELESVHLCDFPAGSRSASATSSSNGDGARARDGPARPRRARAKRRSRSASRCRGGGRRRRCRAQGDRAACGRRARGAQRTASCVSSRRPTSWPATRSSPTTARSGRASASRCRSSRRRSTRSTRRARLRRSPTAERSASRSPAASTTLGADDLLTAIVPLEGYSVEREGSHAVALELAIDDDLLREGRAREIVHAVQNARKEAGLQVEDRIALRLAGDAELVDGRGGLPRADRRRDALGRAHARPAGRRAERNAVQRSRRRAGAGDRAAAASRRPAPARVRPRDASLAVRRSPSSRALRP